MIRVSLTYATQLPNKIQRIFPQCPANTLRIQGVFQYSSRVLEELVISIDTLSNYATG